MFSASMWERRVWREGPHHWSDPLIIWYIVYRVNAGREVTVARGTKHATREIYRKIRQARAAILALVQVFAAGSRPTKFTDRPIIIIRASWTRGDSAVCVHRVQCWMAMVRRFLRLGSSE